MRKCIPRELVTRRCRNLDRGERLRRVIDYPGHRERLSVAIFRVYLAFSYCKLRVAPVRATGSSVQ